MLPFSETDSCGVYILAKEQLLIGLEDAEWKTVQCSFGNKCSKSTTPTK